jgi:hypothetical protein
MSPAIYVNQSSGLMAVAPFLTTISLSAGEMWEADLNSRGLADLAVIHAAWLKGMVLWWTRRQGLSKQRNRQIGKEYLVFVADGGQRRANS